MGLLSERMLHRVSKFPFAAWAVDVKAFARGKGDPPGTGIRAVAVLSAPVITPQWMWVHCRIFCAWFGPALGSIPVRNLRCPSGSSKYYGFCCCSEAPPSFEVFLRNLGCRRESIRPSLPWPFQLRPLRLKLFLFELVLRSNKQVLAVVTPCLPVPKMQCSGPNSH